MIISSIQVKRFENPEHNLKGIASITLDNVFKIHGMKIIEAQKGMMLIMPHKGNETAHPANRKTREILEKLIFEAYSECVVQDWNVLNLSLREEYQNVDFEDLSYECYEIESTLVFIPEKSELVAV